MGSRFAFVDVLGAVAFVGAEDQEGLRPAGVDRGDQALGGVDLVELGEDLFGEWLAVRTVTAAVAPPQSSTISTPPSAKRFHMPIPSRGGRSSSIGSAQRIGGVGVPRRAWGYPQRMLSPRNRELLGLVPAALLVTAGFAAIFIQAAERPGRPDQPHLTLNHASSVSLTYGAIFLGLCLAGHLVIRFALPNADPYLFPLGAVLASVGIVMVYRINPTLARQQAQWMVLGLVLFAATILALRRRGVGVLERYRYTIVAVGIGMTVLPRVPGIGEEVNGAYLNVHVGGISFQPAELAKIALVIFLASYLRDNRQILVTAGRRVLGVTLPPMKQFGPMLVVWGAAMATLLLTRELGTSLMFFGAFLALLYVATGRLSFPLIGFVLFAAGAWFVATHVGHVHARVLDWEHPFEKPSTNRSRAAATSSRSRCSHRPTGVCWAPASTGRSSMACCRSPKAT